ncbi:MAG: bifunctional methylenetetrahydrofolate dehydrogenase/methenyltetrahydrofolate cyclohydrolase FolD [Alphaproteobacteria bacterium]|nr:MAG: bifunctional methylenetetrahydrofolate dehydrogenase/methenyltetrahydrofolate cyclohydrolase FolD [Alphaproteobacteria bacterium]
MTTAARIIDGKALSTRLLGDVSRKVDVLQKRGGTVPCLAAVLVGDDPASQIYIRNKKRTAESIGMHSVVHTLPATIPQDELLALIGTLNQASDVHGILVQMPLPKPLSASTIIAAIAPDKDVDGLHPLNVGRLNLGLPGLQPCTPRGCMMLIREALGENLSGLKAVVLGRSNLVGRPMAAMLLHADCTVTSTHSRSRDLAAESRQADILVAATGQAGMVRGDWIKPGACVIDVGISRLEQADKTTLVGDVAFDEAASRAGFITPVPGGVGPMTIACLFANTLEAACALQGMGVPQ